MAKPAKLLSFTQTKPWSENMLGRFKDKTSREGREVDCSLVDTLYCTVGEIMGNPLAKITNEDSDDCPCTVFTSTVLTLWLLLQ